MRPRRHRAIAVGAALACLAGAVTACVGTGAGTQADVLEGLESLPQGSASAPAAGAGASVARSATEDSCEAEGAATASYRPDAELPVPGQMPVGSHMAEIQARGRLIAGVDQNTLGFGYRNRNGELTGFDIALVREVARALLGDPDAVELRAVVSADRVPAVQSGDVDIVASIMTMTSARWEDVAFSAEYFHGVQKVLVRTDSDITYAADLAGKQVCATRGSTSLDNLVAKVPAAEAYPVATRTECLVELQEGRVQAISTDDTILYGFHEQDPKTRLLDVELADEPYGMAISHEHPEFVRFVNGVLEDLRADGTWQRLHEDLEATLALPAALPPAPAYRD